MTISKPKTALSNKSFPLPWEGMISLHTLISDFRTTFLISSPLLDKCWGHEAIRGKVSSSSSSSLFGLNLLNLAMLRSCAEVKEHFYLQKLTNCSRVILSGEGVKLGLLRTKFQVESCFAQRTQQLPCGQINVMGKVTWVWTGDGATEFPRICFI